MEKKLYDASPDQFADRSIKEMIDWLRQFPPHAVFSVYQSGDRYDGYQEAEISISREETQEEQAEREKLWESDRLARIEQRRQAELQTLRALQEKYGAGA